ncbi:hypothetical protein PtA15_6A646 [Puccinia triticina]|uniref:Crinkler (CRN) family protein n=1 Tax=Puccinia triticina TaxID=208348 RepID=A0ABY7CLA4_9BASI|nr:uncharacterized protein PtA15_6A646 [Puccinia triticina]WAQ86016.1 hypothetical protein PtA15_6A646 [Puccinia triticina]WAR55911.1 hypothetical protein PtB15_6B655 [Puccinia triticina]
MMVPTRIWLSFENRLVSVRNKELELVDDLVHAAKNEFSGDLQDIPTSDITLHLIEHAEALTSASNLAEYAGQISCCANPKTPLIVKVKYPAIIWLSYKDKLVSVKTKGLVFVAQLVSAAKEEYSASLRHFDNSDITLHLTKHAEALTSSSNLAEYAGQISCCADPKTPLIVKTKLHVVRFWEALPKANLVANGEVEYLELKESYVLGRQHLGCRFIVRPVYKDLYQYFETNKCWDKLVINGTPGIGKTVFSAYVMWIAACKQKTVVWEPAVAPGTPIVTYLMTSSGVEVVDTNSPALADALANSDTVYIVDGHAPKIRNVWTLLVTSPQRDHYHLFLKGRCSRMLYMPPWSYKEFQNSKRILYPDEKLLPTTLMDQAFQWYGGVSRYVFEKASIHFKSSGNEDKAFVEVTKDLLEAIKTYQLSDIVQQAINENYSHLVIHICSHPSQDLSEFHLAWASREVERAMADQYTVERSTNIQNALRAPSDDTNFRGMLFEIYAHHVLQEGGSFEVRRLTKGDPPSGLDNRITFPAAKRRTFQTYDEVDLGQNVFWEPESKHNPSIDLLRGPANFFQVTVSETHPIKYHGLRKALKRVKSKSHPRLYFVVPSNIYPTYKYQHYHTQDGKIYHGKLGDIGNVEQWALMIPIGGEKPVRGEDEEPPPKKKAV